MFAMAYTILKLHRKALLKMGMDELLEFLQKTMETDFGFDDDYVIETALKESLAELRSSRLHTAGPPPDSEKPQKPFGLHRFERWKECGQIFFILFPQFSYPGRRSSEGKEKPDNSRRPPFLRGC